MRALGRLGRRRRLLRSCCLVVCCLLLWPRAGFVARRVSLALARSLANFRIPVRNLKFAACFITRQIQALSVSKQYQCCCASCTAAISSYTAAERVVPVSSRRWSHLRKGVRVRPNTKLRLSTITPSLITVLEVVCDHDHQTCDQLTLDMLTRKYLPLLPAINRCTRGPKRDVRRGRAFVPLKGVAGTSVRTSDTMLGTVYWEFVRGIFCSCTL